MRRFRLWDPKCVFCQIVQRKPGALGEGCEIVGEWGPVIAFTPLRPVTPGHVLVIPTEHVENAATDPWLTALVMDQASRYVRKAHLGDANLITSIGPAASQTITHLHIHVIPRREGDGLQLPWSVSAA